MSQNKNKSDLKIFFIKLISIVFGIIIVINVSYNLIIAENICLILPIHKIIDEINEKLRGNENIGTTKKVRC